MNNKEFLRNIHNNFKIFIRKMGETDPFSRSYTIIVNSTNWMLAISTGTLLWFIGSFDKFMISYNSSNKILFFITIICFSISTILLFISRAVLYLRRFKIESAFDELQLFSQIIETEIENENIDKLENNYIENLNKKMDVKMEHAYRLLINADKIMLKPFFFIKCSWIFYPIGLLTLIINILTLNF